MKSRPSGSCSHLGLNLAVHQDRLVDLPPFTLRGQIPDRFATLAVLTDPWY